MKLIPYTVPIIEEPVKPRQPVAWLMEWSDDKFKGKRFATVTLYYPIVLGASRPSKQPVAWIMEWSDERYKGKLFAQVYLYCPSPAHSQDDAIKWAKVTPLYKL